ncbi:MAG: hypothetical protein KGL13_09355 [Gammaproteobacteria bacterium]|nr:hypothetical protein [Gammaproteobacteria bacterium]
MNARSAAGKSGVQISAVRLELLAAVLGIMGTALVILQARWWLPRVHANPAILLLLAFVPLLAAVFIALAPRRMELEPAHAYPARSAAVWLNLGVPVVLTIVVMAVTGISGNFDNFAGFALVLAVNAGRNLRNWISCLMQPHMDARK